MHRHGGMGYTWAEGIGYAWIWRHGGMSHIEPYYHSFLSYIISFCITSNFHKFDEINRQKNMATIDDNLD
jgi:hypothetical protein